MTFSSAEGRRVLEDLKSFTRFNFDVTPVGTDQHTDIHEVMKNEGKRAVVLRILHFINKTEEAQKETIKENL